MAGSLCLDQHSRFRLSRGLVRLIMALHVRRVDRLVGGLGFAADQPRMAQSRPSALLCEWLCAPALPVQR